MARLLGTPNEEIWPGVSSFRDWHEFPQWRPQDLALAVPGLNPAGLDLLAVSHSLPSLILHALCFSIISKLIEWESGMLSEAYISFLAENVGV
jgi:hypothetical protein